MSSTFQNFLKNPPNSLREELISYHFLAEEAKKKGLPKLAARWELLIELIRGFVQYLDSSRDVSFLKSVLEKVSINDRTIEIQEIAHYTASSLTALRNNNPTLAKELIGYAQEIKEAGVRRRYWLSLMKNEVSTPPSLSEPSLEEIAVQYRTNARKATKEKKEAIAQHWTEAACLAQEASRKKELSLSAYVASGNEMLSTYWERSKVASYDAAKFKAQVALSLEQENRRLAEEYDNLALLAEELSSYHENLVLAIKNGAMEMIPHWKSAAEFLNTSLNLKRSLKNFPDHDPLLPYQKMIIASAEQAAESHRKVISQLKKKKKPSLKSVSFAQQSYEEATRALQFFREKNLTGAETLKRRVLLNNEAYRFSKKATQGKEKWYTIGIPFLYWKYRTRKVESLLRSC